LQAGWNKLFLKGAETPVLPALLLVGTVAMIGLAASAGADCAAWHCHCGAPQLGSFFLKWLVLLSWQLHRCPWDTTAYVVNLHLQDDATCHFDLHSIYME
jgi:hypothetical protein